MSIDLDSYNTVPERITEFTAKHPEGTLSRLDPSRQLVPLEFVSYAGADWVILTAFAYRTPDDPNPGVGTAWERIPGTTQFTKGSEIQNAETSAWGRAMVAVLAADTRKGIASQDEVRLAVARQDAVPERDWLAEARAKSIADDVVAVWKEARAKKAPVAILDQVAALGSELRAAEAKLEADAAAAATGELTGGGWPVVQIPTTPDGDEAA